jgi:hypothetical protein
MEHWWNDTDRGWWKYSEKHVLQCQSSQHISHMDWPGNEPGPEW